MVADARLELGSGNGPLFESGPRVVAEIGEPGLRLLTRCAYRFQQHTHLSCTIRPCVRHYTLPSPAVQGMRVATWSFPGHLVLHMQQSLVRHRLQSHAVTNPSMLRETNIKSMHTQDIGRYHSRVDYSQPNECFSASFKTSVSTAHSPSPTGVPMYVVKSSRQMPSSLQIPFLTLLIFREGLQSNS